MLYFASLPGMPRGSDAPEPKTAPYGSWESPIATEMLVQGQVRFSDRSLDGDTLYWTEMRPEEAGRYVIVRRTADGRIEDVLPPPFNARTLVHEYGGGAMLASGGQVFFANFDDQRLWSVRPGDAPQPITSEHELRFADFVHDSKRGRLIAVCEDHRGRDREPVNRIVAIALDTGQVMPLVEGADFYSTPRISPDGRQLAWLSWNHPNMPWDGTELCVAPLDETGTLGPKRRVAGGESESIFQPTWSPEATLYFVSDRTDWWNLYRERNGRVETVVSMPAEFGMPQWVFGLTTFAFAPNGDLWACYTRDGTWSLSRIDSQTGKRRDLNLPYTNVSGIHVGPRGLYAEVSSPTAPPALVEVDGASGSVHTFRTSSPLQPDPDYTSVPEAITFPTDGNRTAHAFYYPPTNRDFQGPPGDAPPLLVIIHGGPTAMARSEFSLSIQYWTSRGFGVCDVNYGGSTGYGRQFRNQLRQAWGIVDVADATNAALYLATRGKADPNQLIIRGGSAGGYTTLAALAFRDVFCAGASYYGVSDLALLARDTHKFESRYMDQLIGPYPQEKQRYEDRSPLHHLDGFDRPLILLQGLEDKIVLPNQAELIFESLKTKGVPVAYIAFPGEQHGFRKAENIIRAHEAELLFYSRILNFPLPHAIPPIEIYSLP